MHESQHKKLLNPHMGRRKVLLVLLAGIGTLGMKSFPVDTFNALEDERVGHRQVGNAGHRYQIEPIYANESMRPSAFNIAEQLGSEVRIREIAVSDYRLSALSWI